MNLWLEHLRGWIAGLEHQSALLRIGIHLSLTLLGGYVLWAVAKALLALCEKRLATRPLFRENKRIFELARRWAFYTVVLLSGTYLIRVLHIQAIENAFIAAVIIGLAFPLKEFLGILFGYMHTRMAARTRTQIDDIIFDLLNRFSGVIILCVAVILALDRLGINIMPFIAGAGVAGIAIGFAAKDTLSNLISGILLIIDRPFEIGDRIEVWSAPKGSSTWGDVVDIGLRATKIRTTDNITIIIPNSQVMNRDIVNYTTLSSAIRVRVNIGIAYDAEVESARRAILQVADAIEWVAKEPPPKVVVRNFGESSVDLQLRVWIRDARKRMDTISEVTDRVKSAFDAAGIEIPYPRRDINIRRDPARTAPGKPAAPRRSQKNIDLQT